MIQNSSKKIFHGLVLNRYGTGTRLKKSVGLLEHTVIPHYNLSGFQHEQTRIDRDDFVEIIHKNIKKGHKHNFRIGKRSKYHHLGAPYDTCSVMHYQRDAFSIRKVT